jgi:DinB family protein
VAVDVLSDRRAVERLLERGIRKVPVIARGDRFVPARNLDAIAEFVGVTSTPHIPLPPAVLIERWIRILGAARRYVRQLPQDHLNDRAVESRDRSIRVLAHHLFRIAEAFLESMIDGAEYTVELADRGPSPGTCETCDDIAHYADAVIGRLRGWETGVPADSWRQTVQTFYGPQSAHELLERSTWHTAQHARQLMYLLERFGIEPDGPLGQTELAGLPLPTGLFD